ncbi:TadE/TadG family type IV pilus assembly protein, partial [Bacteroides nordii]
MEIKSIRRTNTAKLQKGSLTVEAACVMPVILLTLTGTLYLCFHVHNRAWLTSA